MKFRTFIKKFDIFPKYSVDVRRKTSIGGVIAIFAFISMFLLVFIRFSVNLNSPKQQKFVIISRKLPLKDGNVIDIEHLPTMNIHFDILMQHINCMFLSVDVIDRIKESDEAITMKIRKESIDSNGNPILKEQGEIRKNENYSLNDITNESCRIHGTLKVLQSEGTIQITPYLGEDKRYNEDEEQNETKYKQEILDNLNMSHTIRHFSVGLPAIHDMYQLDNHTEIQEKQGRMNMLYYTRIIPRGPDFKFYSFGSSFYQNYRTKKSTKYPGVFINYVVSVIGIEDAKSTYSIDTISEMMSILGGVFAIFTFLDEFSDKLLYGDDDYLPLGMI